MKVRIEWFHNITFDTRLVQALAEVHQNRVTEDSVEQCLNLISARLELFNQTEQERLLYDGGSYDHHQMRFLVDYAFYFECFRNN